MNVENMFETTTKISIFKTFACDFI